MRHTRPAAWVAAAGVLVSLPMFAATSSASTAGRLRPAVTIGVNGNEPLVRAAPDGTLYVSALQHLYVSATTGGTGASRPARSTARRSTRTATARSRLTPPTAST